nr:hypothetical protein TDPV-171 [Oriental turtle dovepox virus]
MIVTRLLGYLHDMIRYGSYLYHIQNIRVYDYLLLYYYIR